MTVGLGSFRGTVWIEWSAIIPIIVMTILTMSSLIVLNAIGMTTFSKPHLERTAKLGARKLTYFFLLVATIVIFWPVIIHAVYPPGGEVGIFLMYPPIEPQTLGLIRPSSGITVSLIYFVIMLVANISVWSFGHPEELRTVNRQ